MDSRLPAELVALCRSAGRIAMLTGAGVSRESGVPTFREKQTGLWERYRAEDLVSVEGFARNPRLVWEWHEWMAAVMAAAGPNPGHAAIARMARSAASFTLITQNIDGLHQRAGCAQVHELHGNIHRIICSAERTPVREHRAGGDPPRCPRCGAFLRRDVVWFGEALPEEALQAAWEAAAECEVFFSVGTSAVVQPAASLALLALRRGAAVVEVNPQETPLSASARFLLRGPSAEILPALVEAVWPEEGISPLSDKSEV
jgi:NAD-dependent deacetylase